MWCRSMLGGILARAKRAGLAGVAASALGAFRLISWLLTSAMYLIQPSYPVEQQFRLAVVGVLLVAALLSTRLLNRSLTDTRQIAALTLAEAFGLPALLLPTGGLSSPFVWYALSPLLTSAVYLPMGYMWGVLIAFLLTAIGTGYIRAFGQTGLPIAGNETVILVLVLVTLVTHVQARLLRALEERSKRTDHTLDYLSQIYQMVESAGTAREEVDLVHLIALYGKQLTGAEKAAYWPAGEDDSGVLQPAPSVIHGLREGIAAEQFSNNVSDWWTSTLPEATCKEHVDEKGARWHVCMAVVRSSERRFGVLLVLNRQPFSADIDVSRTMTFLGYIAGAMIERQRADEVFDRLLVSEEKSRIAAEIHDSVSQSLFSLVYGLQGAISTLRAGKTKEALETLETLREVASSVSREIRASIHQLSPSDAHKTWLTAIRSYLDDTSELYSVQTSLQVTGSEDNLSPALSRAVYRMVREGVSNAARHGRGSHIDVSLACSPSQTLLKISDDGCGFQVPINLAYRPTTGPTHSGLGLLNMNQLARAFDGSLRIDSSPGKGTRLMIRIPDRQIESKGEIDETAARG
jgi:NarL family two-component system sensor histidine kinase LiaS